MNAVTRPRFAEGQILAASDLLGLSAYPRGREERHNRFVHRWGIVSGLDLVAEDAETSDGIPYKKVSVSPGLAIDGEGREVLVTQAAPLVSDRMKQQLGSALKDDESYPVFIASQYRDGTSGAGAIGPCGSGASAAAIEEGFEISFGLPGDETFEQSPSDIAAEPSADIGGQPWKILVGFVTWSKIAGEFADIDSDETSRHRKFAGINAAVVAGDGSSVGLQPKPALQSGDAVFSVRQDDDGPTLIFGTYKSATEIEPLLEVNAKGDVVAKGSLTGKRTGNSVQVQSGLASDGMILPLPPGVTEEQVAAEDGPAVHIQVTPEIDPAGSPDPTRVFGTQVVECRVDEERRLHCRILWFDLADPVGGGGDFYARLRTLGPGTARYTLAVSTTEES